MKNKIKAIFLLLLVVCVFAGCNKEPGKVSTGYKNSETPLRMSIAEVDGVFNPFFSTTATDSSIVSMTQISMLGNDKEGNVTYGNDYPTAVLDMQTVTEGSGDDQTTTYYFVLKNNIKYPNGSYMSIKDVLFNLYVYLDPAYSGSSTIYSTDIVGLQEYRTQKATLKEQQQFTIQFATGAKTRITNLASASKVILDEDANISADDFKAELVKLSSQTRYKNVVVDYEKACELFRKELETDYSNSQGEAYKDVIFLDKDKNPHKNLLSTDVEMFLLNEGYISFDKIEKKLEYSIDCSKWVEDVLAAEQSGNATEANNVKERVKQEAIQTIYDIKVPGAIQEIIYYWQTASQLQTYLETVCAKEYWEANPDREYKNISGIKFANREQSVTVNGKTYGVPTYGDNEQVTSSNEVLSITINGVDPKAKWNFAFNVAPMYYYSDAAHIEKFDYVENFGVEYYDIDFMNDVINASHKIGVPVGAGAYQASCATGGFDNITDKKFKDNNVIYFEAYPDYIMGEPKIKKIRYQVTPQTQMVDAVKTGQLDFVEPNAKQSTINDLNALKGQGVKNKGVTTNGYGYIGINASKVPSLKVRQAIMHSINTADTVVYYGTSATPIHRPMSTNSWAYPKGCTPYYPYILGEIPADLSVVNPDYADYVTSLGKKAGEKLTNEEAYAFITGLITDAGYTDDGYGTYQKDGKKLVYTFTVAGATDDHPAFGAFTGAREILNNCGFQINVTNDSQALIKLSTGDLTVWAAAWSSAIDPDMYQVYHMDSKASSTNNWGYNAIKGNPTLYKEEYRILNELSSLIDDARTTEDQNLRAEYYKMALDCVMQLAVELPTYQREDLYAWDNNKIDESTMNKNPSALEGLINKSWLLSLNEEK